VTGTAPMGEDQALIIADVLGECFGAQMLEAAAAFAVEQEAGKPPQHRLDGSIRQLPPRPACRDLPERPVPSTCEPVSQVGQQPLPNGR
jgi:hypothetical protein